MQVVGELDHGVYARLVDAGWAWVDHEERWDEFPGGTMVLLLGRDGASWFMLEAAPDAPDVGVRVWGPGGEERERLAVEVLAGLGLSGEPLSLESTWPDEEEQPMPDGARWDGEALLAAAGRAPFPLYGLTDAFHGTRDLGGLGRTGEVVTEVTLSHGIRTHARVDVSVAGPLHEQAPDPGRSVDALPMIATELLDRTGARFSSGEELIRASDEILRRVWEDGQIRVDGEPRPFRFLREGAHWAAVHDLPPAHLLYVVASNVEPSEIELTRLDSLVAYG